MDRLLVRDEREVSIDRAADRFAYVVLSALVALVLGMFVGLGLRP